MPQLSFRKTGTMGTLASQAEIAVWVKAPRTLPWVGVYQSRNVLYAKSCNLKSIFGQKIVRNAVYNALQNTLTMETPFSCVPAAFQQWILRSHAFPLEKTPDVFGLVTVTNFNRNSS